MKKFWLLTLLAAIVGFGLVYYSWKEDPNRPLKVPTLRGDYVHIPLDELNKITPIGWAMLLDEDHSARTQRLFNEECEKNPELLDEVVRITEIRHMIMSRTVVVTRPMVVRPGSIVVPIRPIRRSQ